MISSDPDSNHDEAAALRKSNELQNPGLLLAIMLGKQPPSQLLLDETLPMAYNLPSVSVRNLIVEILLCAGAQGDKTAAVLVKCVQSQDRELLQLLLRHGCSINFDQGRAVSIAVERVDTETFDLLLRDSILENHNATKAFLKIHSVIDPKTRYHMMQKLIALGASGPALHKELIKAVKSSDMRLTQLLLIDHHSVEYRDGQVLRIAVQDENVDLLVQLLSKCPTTATMGAVLPLIQTCTTKTGRYLLTKAFLDAGVEQEAIDIALRDAVQDQSLLRDLSLIKLLSSTGGRADWNQGQSLASSVRQGDLEVVRTLLRGTLDATAVSAQVPLAMGLMPRSLRYQMLESLVGAISLGRGTAGMELQNALVQVVHETPLESELLELLLNTGRADLNYQNGEALRKAVMNLNHSTVASMLSFQDKPHYAKLKSETISNILSTTVDLSPDDNQKLRKLKSIADLTNDEGTLSDAIIWEVERHAPDATNGFDSTIAVLKVLFNKGAKVNAKDGKAVLLATDHAALPILKLLLEQNADREAIDAALFKALDINPPDNQLACSRALLNAGCSAPVIDRCLATAAARGSRSLSMTQLLLDFGASPGWDDGAAIKAATKSKDQATLKALLSRIGRERHQEHTQQRRNAISGSLILAVHMRNLSLCKLLLKYRASVHYGAGEAILGAVKLGEMPILSELLKYQPRKEMLTSCFDIAKSLEPEKKQVALGMILGAGMTGALVDDYLIELVESCNTPASLIALLIRSGASVHHQKHRSMRSATVGGSYEVFTMVIEAANQRLSFGYCFGEGMQYRTSEVEAANYIPGSLW